MDELFALELLFAAFSGGVTAALCMLFTNQWRLERRLSFLEAEAVWLSEGSFKDE